MIVELVDFRGAVYILVSHGGGDYNTATSGYVLRVLDFVVEQPVLVQPTVHASRETDTSLRLSWSAALDARGLSGVDYAIYAFPERPAFGASIFSATKNQDKSQAYFLRGLCSAEAASDLVRPFSVLAVSLRGESYILSPDNSTLHWDLTGLRAGFWYRFSVFARNGNGQIAAYDTLRVRTWQIGPRGTAVLVVLLIVLLGNLGLYFFLAAMARKKRRNMLVTTERLPKRARDFTASDIEGYFYLVPRRVLKSMKPDEEIVWAGRPDYDLYTRYWMQCYFVLAASTLLILFAVGWFLNETFVDAVLGPYVAVFFAASLLFFVTIPTPRHTVYALTNRRAIVYRRYLWVLPHLRSYPYEQMNGERISSLLLPDQSGCVFFDCHRSWFYRRVQPHGFWHVENAHRAILHINHYREEFYKKYFMHDQPFSIAGNAAEDSGSDDDPYAYLMR